MSELHVNDLSFEVRRSSRRRTMQITVDRDGELLLFAPSECPESKLAAFVRQKRTWIHTKLAEKEASRVVRPRKEFVTGEGFPYLGRSYRLLLVDDQDVPVKLVDGRFRMRRDCASDGHKHMVRWYREHAAPWLRRRMEQWTGRIGVKPTGLAVKDLGYRWGSCSPSGTVNFHWKTILLPAAIVDYVIVHELVHLREQHHTPEFWRRVERAMPDYERRKGWLAERGNELA
ncbi:MAG: M48 family metallopeptidase [Myxococcota bacterium]